MGCGASEGVALQIKDYTKGKKLPTGREAMPVLMYIYSWDTIKTDDIIPNCRLIQFNSR